MKSRGPLTSFLKGRREFPPAHTRLHCPGPHSFLWFPDEAQNHFSQKRTPFFPWFALLHDTWSLVPLTICSIMGILSALYFPIVSTGQPWTFKLPLLVQPHQAMVTVSCQSPAKQRLTLQSPAQLPVSLSFYRVLRPLGVPCLPGQCFFLCNVDKTLRPVTQ